MWCGEVQYLDVIDHTMMYVFADDDDDIQMMWSYLNPPDILKIFVIILRFIR